MNENEVLTPDEVARELRVRIETVYRWCNDGLGTKYGKQWRITRGEIAAFFPKDTAHGLEVPAIAKEA